MGEEVMTCPDCDGTGELAENGLIFVCSTCEGEGNVPVAEEEAEPYWAWAAYDSQKEREKNDSATRG